MKVVRLKILTAADIKALFGPSHHGFPDLVGAGACRRCKARLRFIATIESPEAIRRILTHLGLPTTLPRPDPARAPPGRTGDLFEEFAV